MKQQTTTSEPTLHSLPPALIHDLRTPLNQIIGYSEMLSERAKESGQSEFLPDLEKVCLAGQRLLGIIAGSFEGTAQMSTNGHVDTGLVDAATREVPPYKPHASEVGPNSAEGRVLVVDDDEGNRDVLSQRLKKQGHTVANAEDGRQALAMLEAESYDLVLLDIMMPEMDGYEVLSRLKESDRLRNVPVIMISALNEMESVVRCIEMGAEDYLTKPFNAVLLKARIGACLEKKRGRDREVHLYEQLQLNFARLQELERLRDDLINMIIHDLRTPLTSVIAAIQTLGVVGPVNKEQCEILEIAEKGAGALLTMINSLLDVEKYESGAMDIEYTLLSLPEVVAAAMAQVAPLASEKGIAFAHEMSSDLPWLNGDENKLQRVLVNLLGNAVKFTPSGGSITLQVRNTDDKKAVEFCVHDTGEGIPPESFERIFEKFGQVDSREGGRSMSTGLGLTFCKFAVEAHGGQIGVESTLGRGSSFCFTIPLSAPTPPATDANRGD
jgi:two-component system sensor histidine kinase/response regulator